jgi:hypothetical protein
MKIATLYLIRNYVQYKVAHNQSEGYNWQKYEPNVWPALTLHRDIKSHIYEPVGILGKHVTKFTKTKRQ